MRTHVPLRGTDPTTPSAQRTRSAVKVGGGLRTGGRVCVLESLPVPENPLTAAGPGRFRPMRAAHVTNLPRGLAAEIRVSYKLGELLRDKAEPPKWTETPPSLELKLLSLCAKGLAVARSAGAVRFCDKGSGLGGWDLKDVQTLMTLDWGNQRLS
jgi:hypothetical protein